MSLAEHFFVAVNVRSDIMEQGEVRAMTANPRFAGVSNDRCGKGDPLQQIVLRAPGSLRPNPRNARTHSKRQIRQLANSIKATGFIGAVIIDENDMILAGRARSKASELLGMSLVPTIRVSGLSETQKRTFVLADNKIAENAGWDREILAAELGDLAELLPVHDWNLSLTGFEPAEIDALFADVRDSKADPADTLPPPVDHVVTRSGDLWTLGRHRLLCGDACSRTSLDRLMEDARARMVFADVPYNVQISRVQGRGRVKHPEFAYASGEMTRVQYIDFLEEALGNAARISTNGAVHYVCSDWRHIEELITAGRKVYGAILNLCVWAKTNAGQGSFYRSQHELIGVFRAGTERHQNNVELGRFGRNRSNLWTYAGANGFGVGRMELVMHPTIKPIALVADAMRDCTAKGDAVLDPFLGSGTTLLAAEKIGRRGYGLEFEPRYVDVSIRRWQAYTKSEAVLDGDGRTFAEVKAERLALESANADVPGDTIVSGDDHAEHDGSWVNLCEEVTMILPKGEAK
jgi:DNA modification methylase